LNDMTQQRASRVDSPVALTPTQFRIFDQLLSVGTERPVMPVTLAHELAEMIEERTTPSLRNWTETRMWLSKSRLETALRCEGQLVADANAPRTSSLHPATAVGIVAHRAIQMAHTHPGRPIGTYVDSALRASHAEDAFAEFWSAADMAVQSDLVGQMVSRVTSFLDSFPPLDPVWTPRFEESIQSKIGRLLLAAKPDFTLGRPRPDLRQTMFLADMKTGSINDAHFDEAMFYALVATLRFGVAPYRSVVYSLASGEWTDPDVTPERLWAAAERVVAAVESITDVLTDRRPPLLTSGRWCTWCPARDTCPSSERI
jgi:hypothetical protein